MKLGKILAIVVAVGLVAMMVYMISSSSARPQAKPTHTAPKSQPITQNTPDTNFSVISTEDEQKLNDMKQEAKEREFAVSRLYLTTCAPCHADNGKGKVAPSIAGKSREEILTRLADYKSGKISNTMMSGLLKNVSDETLNELASEISKFK